MAMNKEQKAAFDKWLHSPAADRWARGEGPDNRGYQGPLSPGPFNAARRRAGIRLPANASWARPAATSIQPGQASNNTNYS